MIDKDLLIKIIIFAAVVALLFLIATKIMPSFMNTAEFLNNSV